MASSISRRSLAAWTVSSLVWLVSGAAADVGIEGEDLVGTARASDGRVIRQDMARFGSGWSGGAQLFWTPSRDGAELVLRLELPETSRYQLRLAFTRAPDYARIHVSLAGLDVGEIDGFAPRVEHATSDVGDLIDLSDGTHELVLTVAGRHESSRGFFAGVDRIDLVGEDATPPPPQSQPETPPTPEPLLPPWTSKDVIDKRIDVAAQYALMRMFKGDPSERVDASNILSAVKSGALLGIYQEDQKVPALRAQSLGTWWGTILPKPVGGIQVDGVCMLPPPEKPPIIVMRRKAEKNPAAYDRSLQAAWAMCGLPPSPVRPYSTSPGTPLPPGKAGRCAFPKQGGSDVAVLLVRDGKPVEGADLTLSSKGYNVTQSTSEAGIVSFEPLAPDLYLLTVPAGGQVAPEEAVAYPLEVLPSCSTRFGLDLAQIERGRDDCARAEARARLECVEIEDVEARQSCYQAFQGAVGSCPEGMDDDCEQRATRLLQECLLPLDEKFESCRRAKLAEAGCQPK